MLTFFVFFDFNFRTYVSSETAVAFWYSSVSTTETDEHRVITYLSALQQETVPDTKGGLRERKIDIGNYDKVNVCLSPFSPSQFISM